MNWSVHGYPRFQASCIWGDIYELGMCMCTNTVHAPIRRDVCGWMTYADE